MATPISLFRPVAGERIDPQSIDATGATLGHVLTAVSDGSGGQRAGYAAPGGSSYTDENAQDAVGGILDDGGDIDFTYDDATPKITALVKARAVTWAKVQAMTSGKLLGRSTASSGDVEEITVGSGLSLSSGTLSATGGTSSVDVRKNSTGSTFTRPRINLIEGSGVTLTVTDDSTDNEVDVTIAATGSGGKIAQVVNTQTGAVATGTTTIPFDDTIPQNTEGTEFMSLSITPTNASSKLKIDVVFWGTNANINHWLSVALFQDSAANALAAFANFQPVGTAANASTFTHYMTAGTTSATTFKVRAGPNTADTVTFNGQSGGRIFGGVMASSITITEILP